jgi:hypothetical protein
VNRLVGVGRRDALWESLETADGWDTRELGVSARWPLVRGGGTRLWSCSVQRQTNGATSSLQIHDIATDGNASRLLFSNDYAGGIAPRVPLYVNPSPSGERAVVVVPGDGNLRMELVEPGTAADDGTPAWVVADCGPGGPIFPAWAPGGDHIAVHRGVVLETLDASGEVLDRVEGASAFRTPAWSPDSSRVAYAAVRAESIVELRIAPFDSFGRARVLAEFRAGLVLRWQPGTEWLSVATSSDPSATSFTALVAVHAESGEQRTLYRGPFVGFWWAPDGSRVVLMTPTQAGDGSFRLLALDAEGRVIGASDAVAPSEDCRLAVAFFDQYSESHSPWLPDSSGFIVSGRMPGDARPSTFGDVAHNYVYLWTAKRGQPLVRLGKGDFASAAL